MGQGSFQPWDMGALMQGSGMPGAQQAGAAQQQGVPMGVLQAMAPPRQQAAPQQQQQRGLYNDRGTYTGGRNSR
jgi:hypothetical protein